MQSHFLNLVLTICLFMQCGGSAAQRSVESNPVPEQAPSSANKSVNDECDFSSYAPVRILHFDSKAVIKEVEPEYPKEAVQHHIQGRVIVKVLINKSGDVEKSCATEGDETLRPSAEKAALQWKFKPGYGLAFLRPKTKKNPKNYAEVYIVFDFKLDKAGAKAMGRGTEAR